MRFYLALLLLVVLTGAAMPDTVIQVALPQGFPGDAGGRLLVFVQPLAPGREGSDHVDIGGPDSEGVSVAARDVTSFGASRTVAIDTNQLAFPKPFSDLAAGEYRIQVVLDRNGDYNYSGRGPGDLVSDAATIRFPLSSPVSIDLEDIVPPASGQFDTTGFPARAAEQVTASRSHLHDEYIVSSAITKFLGTQKKIGAWVLTPPGYDPTEHKTYPTVYMTGAFGSNHKSDGQYLSRIWHMMETGDIPPMIWVSPDFSSPTGTTEFADSVNNGPWGQALVEDVIPALESRYRMDAKPSGRFLTGHSSGGWFALWTVVRYPKLFGGSWPTSPDPVDFHAFLGVDIYAADANVYRDASGNARPMERDHDKILGTIEQTVRLEEVLGHAGGQISSFDWVFSPRGEDGKPIPLFDRQSGVIDPDVAAYWRQNFDIGHRIESGWPILKHDLDGKVHVTVGELDSYYLDSAVRRLKAVFEKVGGKADFTFVPNANHGVNQVYTRGDDRNALWKQMARAMYAIARPARR